MKSFLILILSAFCFVSACAQLNSGVADMEKKQFLMRNLAGQQSVASNNYDVTFYRCQWEVNPAVRFISGSVTMHYTLTSASNTIILDMHTSLNVDSIIHRGARASYSHLPNHALQINFSSAASAGQKDSVKIYYRGIPASVGFGSFILSSHANVPVLWTLSEPYGAPTWWPCKDSNTDKPDSIDIILTIPSQYTSSSNGLPVAENISGATKTTYWKHRYPIAPYLVAIAVTNYQVSHDAVNVGGRNLPVVMYAYPESAAAFAPATATAKTALQVFSPLFTEYPFIAERYAQTQFSWGGGMEHQTNSFITSASSGLVAHELAHQWFGDKVTCGTWHDLWLNEGFATYSENIYIEQTNAAARQAQLQSWRNNITSVPDGSVYIPDTTNINRMFNYRLTYLKAGYLLHMLRWKLGDSSFFRGVRRYVNDPALAFKTAKTEDLQRNLEAESGENLSEFFKDWYKGEGYPNYTARWYQPQGRQLRIQLSQTQSHPSVSFFEMPVQILLRGSGQEKLVRLEHTLNGEIFSLDPGFTVDTLIIDPQQWLITRDNRSIKSSSPIGANQFSAYPNPAREKVTLAFPISVSGFVLVELYDALGRKLYSQSVQAMGSPQLNLNKYAAGVYWLRATGEGIDETRQLFITRTP